MLKKQATKKAKKRESRRKTDELTEREKDRSKYVSAYEQIGPMTHLPIYVSDIIFPTEICID